MKTRIIALTTLALCVMAILFYSSSIHSEGAVLYSIPPVIGEMIIRGDNIYFLHNMGIVAKHNKNDLSEIDTLEIDGVLNITYSSYLDRIIGHADFDPSKIVVIDYDNMEVESENAYYRGRISGVCCSGDKLYFTADNCGIPLGGHYTPGTLPPDTGKLVEVDMDNMAVNWEMTIATMPNYMVDAGQYIAITSEEYGKDEIMNTGGSILSIIDKDTRAERRFIVGETLDTYIEYDGDNKIYISNPDGMWEPVQGKTSGLSILDMSSWEIEHVVFEKDPEERQYWKAYGTYLDGDELYMAFYNAKFNGKTYYGVYDTITGEMETHEIPGISQFLIFVEKDGDNLYFSTNEDWLIKYTPE